MLFGSTVWRLACGLPVVCSYDEGGSNIRYVGDYNLCGTAPTENADAFAGAILGVLADGSYLTEVFVSRAMGTLWDLNVTWDALVDRVEASCQSAVLSS